MPDVGLLWPGAADDDVTDDVAVLRALLTAEVAWVRAQAAAGLVPPATATAVASAAATLGGVSGPRASAGRPGAGAGGRGASIEDSGAIGGGSRAASGAVGGGSDAGGRADAERIARDVAVGAAVGGNPVIPLLAVLRDAAPEHAAVIHAGLTSQDVLDTALVLVLRDAARAAVVDLDRAVAAAARLARTHRDAPALGRTLAQAAVPTTLGARFAGWLGGLHAARRSLADAAAALPLAYGGAAGELSGVARLTGDPFGLVDAWGAELGLPVPPGPWHTVRTPTTRAAAAFAETCAALGHVAGDVLQGVRPGTEELREPAAPGRGASSAMPHKRNPVLSVLLRRSAIAAPHLAATVQSAAGLAADERPDGAWHAEWPALRDLARHAVVAARLGAELLDGLDVDAAAAARNLRSALPDADGVGAAPAIVDRVLAAVDAPTRPTTEEP